MANPRRSIRLGVIGARNSVAGLAALQPAVPSPVSEPKPQHEAASPASEPGVPAASEPAVPAKAESAVPPGSPSTSSGRVTGDSATAAADLLAKMKAEREERLRLRSEARERRMTRSVTRKMTRGQLPLPVGVPGAGAGTPSSAAAQNPAVPAAKKPGRSLADIQKAIKEADRRKKQAKREALENKIDRTKREVALKKAEEAAAQKDGLTRVARRMTIRIEEQKRSKVDEQLGQFVSMMQVLEKEFTRMDDARVEREQQLLEAQSMLSRTQQQVVLLSDLLLKSASQMDQMKTNLDSLVDSFPKKLAKGSPFFSEMGQFQESFWTLRHKMYIEVAKQAKESKALLAEQGYDAGLLASALDKDGSSSSAVPLPPAGGPPVAPPAPPAPTATVNPVSHLLSQIKSGTSLKKIDPEALKQERLRSRDQWRQSVTCLRSLQDTLQMALDQRQKDLKEYDSDDSDEDDDWTDEDDEDFDTEPIEP